MSWHHFFIPHKETHQKAHLISWHGLAVYVLLFIILQVSFQIISVANPGILGTTSNINQKRLIELTNQERQKKGLNPLSENEALNAAAEKKAQNMFAENYWAHFSPSGKSPWDFINSSGYKFTYAGENLAKNFHQSEDVVSAWMASPTHRDNILSPNYKEIGIAVVDGNLNGVHTTLVVQEFGSRQVLAFTPRETPTQKIEVPTGNLAGQQFSVNQVEPLLDPIQITKIVGISFILIIMLLLIVDYLSLRKRGVFRLTSHYVAHMAVLSVAAAGILSSGGGSIL